MSTTRTTQSIHVIRHMKIPIKPFKLIIACLPIQLHEDF
jgi:hypothetical protein